MAIFEDQLKLLQERNKLFTKESNLRKQTKAEEMSDTKAAQTGPVAFIRGMEQAEARQRAKASRAKAGDDREVLLENLQAENDYLRSMETQLQKQQAAIETRQQVASAGTAALLEYSSGGKSLEDVNRALTAALGVEGAYAQYDPASMQVQAFNPDGQLSVTATLRQLLTAAGYESSKIGGLISQISGTAGLIATAEGQVAGQESLAEARTVAEGVGGGISDVRVGVGLDKPIERTQEIPFTGTANMDLVAQRTRGQITTPEQLAAINAAAADPYLRKGGIQEQLRTEAQTAQSNLQLAGRALDVLERAKEKGLKITGTLGSLKQGARKFFKEAGLPVDDKVLEDFAVLESTALEQAIQDLANFKGPTTDFEFGKVEAANANTSRTVEENLELLSIVQGAAEKSALKPRFISDYIGRTNYGLVGDAEDRFAEFTNQVPSTIPMEQKQAELQKYLEDPNYIYTETIPDGPLPVEQPAQQQVDYVFNPATGRLEKVGQ